LFDRQPPLPPPPQIWLVQLLTPQPPLDLYRYHTVPVLISLEKTMHGQKDGSVIIDIYSIWYLNKS
jgi:hypothetical protein